MPLLCEPSRWLGVVVLCLAWPVAAGAGSRLVATGGANSIEGSAGGGIVPWAVLAGYGDTGEFGCSAGVSHLATGDYGLRVIGGACSYGNRVEIALSEQELDLDGLRPLLGLADEQTLRQRSVSAKIRLYGDITYDRRGQLSLGIVHKKNHDGWLARAAGAMRESDIEAYLSLGRLFIDGPFGHMWYGNVSLRYTRANQGGLLGFGGDLGRSRRLVPEVALAWFPWRKFAIGAEYRANPDNLSFAVGDDWTDLFVAWFPSKRWSVVAAWVDLGSVGTLDGQSGLFFSANGSF